MIWERFFFYLNRFNALAIAAAAIILLPIFGYGVFIQWQYNNDWEPSESNRSFGSEFVRTDRVIGHRIDTRGGKFVAYYESDDLNERKDLAGLVLVNLEDSRVLPIATAGDEFLVNFAYLFDQGDETRPVVGYIARVANEADFKEGKSNLVIGALPAMSRTVVAESVRYVDLPTVRSDGNLALVMWQEEDQAEVLVFNLSNGEVLDRKEVKVSIVDPKRLSQGPGKSFDPALLRLSASSLKPRNTSGF